MKKEEKDDMIAGILLMFAICFGNLFLYATYVAIEEFSVGYLFIAIAFGLAFILFAFWTVVVATHKRLIYFF